MSINTNMVGDLMDIFTILTGMSISAYLANHVQHLPERKYVIQHPHRLHKVISKEDWSADWHMLIDEICNKFKNLSTHKRKELICKHHILIKFVDKNDGDKKELTQLHNMIWKI